MFVDLCDADAKSRLATFTDILGNRFLHTGLVSRKAKEYSTTRLWVASAVTYWLLASTNAAVKHTNFTPALEDRVTLQLHTPRSIPQRFILTRNDNQSGVLMALLSPRL